MCYYTYIVQCADGSLYTGWTLDVKKRLIAHNSGAGAKYTRSRRPVKLVWSAAYPSQNEAMHWEAEIKTWSRRKKMDLVQTMGRP